MHLPPKNFQRVRWYGIHANKVNDRVNNLLKRKVRKNGQTIRRVFEILTQLLKRQPFVCEKCASEDIEIHELERDKTWIFKYITLPRIRAPSTGIVELEIYYEPCYYSQL